MELLYNKYNFGGIHIKFDIIVKIATSEYIKMQECFRDMILIKIKNAPIDSFFNFDKYLYMITDQQLVGCNVIFTFKNVEPFKVK